MQKAHDHNQPLYMCFIDYHKAFDGVKHGELWLNTMSEMGFLLHGSATPKLISRTYQEPFGVT